MNYLSMALLLIAAVPLSLPASEVDFVRDVRPILQRRCYSCHGEQRQKSGLRLDVRSEAFRGGDGYGPAIVPGKPDESPLLELVSSDDDDARMPPEGEPLSAGEILTLTRWIRSGAVWPDGVDLVRLEDRLDHWAFKPIRAPVVPEPRRRGWARNDLDRFILARLEQEGLSPAPEASAVTWLRRVTLDLTGLPPDPDEVSKWLRHLSEGEAAFAAVVDRLLASPRHGERWAQHWLDVVRYADTHGFEVNTERPNAWPYRDYVIEAFNRDTPYDQFIREQIAGDAFGADTATGFLVTASVLLPGQIGKDGPSMRLARQDALDEIVNNIGQTFLGLSVGCARCHDHKFDPITARDYYSMQAFVAGVEYADRAIPTADADARRQRAVPLRRQVAAIEEQLAELVPIARPGAVARTTSPRENTEDFPPIEARFVKFTVHDASLHPSLGLIEPCLDEFEIITAEAEPTNVALAAVGTKVTASGSRTSAAHRLSHVNDGQFGNARSWMSDTPGRGWLLFELPEPTRISRVVWSRDRTGHYSDRLPIAYTLEAGPTVDSMKRLVHVPPRRSAVQPEKNVDSFEPCRVKRLRLTILATSGLEPCLDEIEVFSESGENVALADAGTTVTTSGDRFEADRHEPRFVNDGKFGNSRSWMSNETGRGWVELEFPVEQTVTRVVWSRDRDGRFKDRLATEYRIEVAADEDWITVADSSDRHPWTSEANRERSSPLTGLTGREADAAQKLLESRRRLQAQIEKLEQVPLAFAGIFRRPDEIHLLRRGDPEQPANRVVPAVLSALGDVRLAVDAAEQTRRRTLADWIASPDNVLTARVMVNRIWQWHFGTGLVETPNDFGRNGARPSHPELLDWLARELIRSGWSIRHIDRLIVLSSTYRQSTRFDARAAAKDAGVRLLWRFPTRRLDAEAIRDCMVAVSGQLNLTMGGRGFDLFQQRGGLSGFTPIESFEESGLRRLIYAHKVRRERDAVFGAFDCPDAGQSAARRSESTTPIQALNLFNSRFTLERAEAFAARIRTEAGDEPARQIRRAFELALNRQPTAEETADILPAVRAHGLPVLCRALFNSNEFLFLP